MILELTIGRDASTGQLRMSNGKQSQLFGEKDCVPKSVSREHVKLCVTEKGEYILKNLNIENDTYVNGKCVEQKLIQRGDRILLGTDHWKLSWHKYLDPILPKFADIRPLEKIYQDYENKRLRMQIKERRFNTIRSATGILTLGAMALSINGFLGKETPIYGYLYIVAAIITALGFVWSYRLASKIPIENDKHLKETKKKYVCPECGKQFVLQDYDQLKQQGRCQYCKAIFIS
jgi:DNA-directed RNA polymerase subunit RPC12/RpoP